MKGEGQRNGLGCVQCPREIEASTVALNFLLFCTLLLKGNPIASLYPVCESGRKRGKKMDSVTECKVNAHIVKYARWRNLKKVLVQFLKVPPLFLTKPLKHF